MNWIDIKKVHPDQVIDWDKVEEDEFPVLAVVHFKDGLPDIMIEDLVRPEFRGNGFGSSEDGFCYTGSMEKISHWMLLPEIPKS